MTILRLSKKKKIVFLMSPAEQNWSRPVSRAAQREVKFFIKVRNWCALQAKKIKIVKKN
jgi:hypothetical protein